MFNLYHSNQLDILKELMAHFIAKDPLADPFVEEQVLVQSPGMAQWVKMELAKSMGISANITFPLPASFIWKMFQKVLPDIPDKSAFNKEAMSWKLMLILPELLVLPEFESLKHYLADDQDDYRLFQLCLENIGHV
ncbi:exodeoxyribonuclease V subunit gamma [Moritella viscosa]|uniref:exodeoxyribonuclease V subunit gamma n=1 Tax=Moritella viscosa TaxID=80854 RepID=UPI00406CB18B